MTPYTPRFAPESANFDGFIHCASQSHGMVEDATTLYEPRGREVMAAIDSDDHGSRLVIADVTADGAWLSVSATAAARLLEWR